MAERYRGLLVDFGGVLTTHLGDHFRAFWEGEGVDFERVRETLREAYGEANPESLVAKFEMGRIEVEDFERELATVLSQDLERPVQPEGLVTRMLADLRLDDDMVSAVRAAHDAGIRTALLSNSWGVEYYPHDLLAELFDEIVISGQVGLRKPNRDIFELAVRTLGIPAGECVFVDDLQRNIDAAEEVGIRGVLHERASETIPELERLFGISPLVATL